MIINSAQGCPVRAKVLSYGFIKLLYGLLTSYFFISEIFGILFAANNTLGPINSLASLPQLIIFRCGLTGSILGCEIIFSGITALCASRGVFTGVAKRDRELLQSTCKSIIVLAVTIGLMCCTIIVLFCLNYENLNSLIFEYFKTVDISENNKTEFLTAIIQSTESPIEEADTDLRDLIFLYTFGLGTGIVFFLIVLIVVLVFDVKALRSYIFNFDDQYLTDFGVRTEMTTLVRGLIKGDEAEGDDVERARLINDL